MIVDSYYTFGHFVCDGCCECPETNGKGKNGQEKPTQKNTEAGQCSCEKNKEKESDKK